MTEDRVFSGGMNFDDDSRLLPNGDYIAIANAYVTRSVNGKNGIVTKCYGNTEIQVVGAVAGSNTVVHSIQDESKNRVIYLVYNDQLSHHIVEYLFETNIATVLLVDPLFDFQLNVDYSSVIIDDSDTIYWTDTVTEPKKFSIDLAKKGEYVNTTRDFYEANPTPPNNAPIAEYFDIDEVYEYNNNVNNQLNLNLFQFKHRYTYKDNSFSTFSPISLCAFPKGVSWAKGSPIDSENNCIKIEIDKPNDFVNKIEVAVRETNKNDFYITDILKSIDSKLTHEFNMTVGVQDNATGVTIQTFAPIFDIISVGDKVTLTKPQGSTMPFEGEYTIIAIDESSGEIVIDAQYSGTNLGYGGIDVRFSVSYADQDKIRLLLDSVKYIDLIDIPTSNALFSYFPQQCRAIGQSSDNRVLVGDLSIGFDVSDKLTAKATAIYNQEEVASFNNRKVKRTFKRYAKHRFAVQYYDYKLRANGSITNSNLTVKVEGYKNDSNIDGHVDIQIDLGGIAPAGSKYYNILYGGRTDIGLFFQAAALSDYSNGVEILGNDDLTKKANPFFFVEKGWYARFVWRGGVRESQPGNFLVTEVLTDTGSVKLEAISGPRNVFDIVEGDILEFYQVSDPKDEENIVYKEIGGLRNILPDGTHGGEEIAYQYQRYDDITFYNNNTTVSPNVVGPHLDVPNTRVVNNLELGSKVRFLNPNVAHTNIDTNTLYEVISVEVQATSTLYFLNISGGNGLGSASVEDLEIAKSSTSLIGARILIESGDVFYKYRSFREYQDDNNVNSIEYYIEDKGMTDFEVIRDSNDYGRPSVLVNNQKKKQFKNYIYYTEPIVLDTDINGLGLIYDLNFVEMPKEFGAVYKISNEGEKVDVYQEDRVSFMLSGRDATETIDGARSIVASATVLSQPTSYLGIHGINKYPNCFARNANSRYFADFERGTVCRLANNGITKVSDYKMHSYFKNLLTQDVIKCQGIFISNRDCYSLYVEKESTNVTVIRQLGTLLEIEIDEHLAISRLDTIGGYATNLVKHVAGNRYILSNVPDTLPTNTTIKGLFNGAIEFEESSNRWRIINLYKCDYQQAINNGFMTFVNGVPFMHDTNAERSTYTNAVSPHYIKGVVNKSPLERKAFRALSVRSENKYYAQIVSKNQETRIVKDRFRNIQGGFHAHIPRDINTPNIDIPLVNGQPIKGDVMEVVLDDSTNEPNSIIAFGSNQNIQERTNK